MACTLLSALTKDRFSFQVKDGSFNRRAREADLRNDPWHAGCEDVLLGIHVCEADIESPPVSLERGDALKENFYALLPLS